MTGILILLHHRTRYILWALIAVFAAVVLTGIDWGLPSRRADRDLFASRQAWTGADLAAFDAERRDEALGADVDRDPANDRSQPRVVNLTDEDRAEILRRYRLFSAQPDEMITFMALQQMRPGEYDFDPRLYQYGGLWIYPVGALLKAAGALGAVDLRNDKAFYYDKPSAFGRFYVVARLYTLAWYVVLLIAAACAVRRLTGSDAAAIATAALVGASPVVFALAHEAKPHLPGAALMLLACLAAYRWVENGRNRDAILAGLACGLAAGMVLSAAIIGIVLPVMVLLRKATFARRAGALALGVAWMIVAYCLTNPYVPINLLRDAPQLTSNLANTSAMYGQGGLADGVLNGAQRLVEAASPVTVILPLIAIVLIATRRKAPSALAWLIAAPATIVLIQFFALAAGKPAEYGRFALFPAVALAIASAWALSQMPWRWPRMASLTLAPALLAAIWTWPYVIAFLTDAQQRGTRELAADKLRALVAQGDDRLQVYADPAPYTLPPLDLWRWRITLTPHDLGPADKVVLRPVDDPTQLKPPPEGYERHLITAGPNAPITWANKPFEILVRE